MPTSSHAALQPSRRVIAAVALLVALLALAVTGPSSALARGGGGGARKEVRVSGTCSRGATSKLTLKQRDGRIEAEFEIDHNRAGTLWSVAVVQEHRVVWRGKRRTAGRSGSFSVSRSLADLVGADQVMARGVGPRGLTCTAIATLRG